MENIEGDDRRLLGMAILEEMEAENTPVLPREPEDRAEIASLIENTQRRWKKLK